MKITEDLANKISRFFEMIIAKKQEKNEITGISRTSAIRQATYLQHYGFASCVYENTECYVLNRNGEQGDSFVFATTTEEKPQLQEGEVCLYDKYNNLIKLAENGIEIKSGKLIINCDVQVNGSVTATSDIKTNTDVTAGIISLAAHKHTTVGIGSPTTPAIP